MSYYTLWALGSNGSGQLGISNLIDVSEPTRVSISGYQAPPSHPTLPPSFSSPIRAVVGGGNHTLVLLQSSEFYWAGDPAAGAFGTVPETASPESIQPVFYRIVFTGWQDYSPRFAAATWEASVAVLHNAESGPAVLVCGAGSKGELGLGDKVTRTGRATMIVGFPPKDTEIVDIAACMSHVVAVLSNGEAWGWGAGRKGQLGEPREAAVWSPRRITGIPFQVVRVVCGREFTCFFGDPKKGELEVLGSDKWGIRSNAPSAEKLAGWKDVGASWGHIYVLNEDGRLLTWGRTDHGQGVPEDLGEVRLMAAGSEHALVLTESGDVESWGWGEHGNCGTAFNKELHRGIVASENEERGNKGIKGFHKRITAIGAGCATSWIATEEQCPTDTSQPLSPEP